MNIKKGDVLKEKFSGRERIVLGIIEELYFISCVFSGKKEQFGISFYTLKGLKETFELPEEKWAPNDMKEKIERLAELVKNPLASQEKIMELKKELQFIDLNSLSVEQRNFLSEAMK